MKTLKRFSLIIIGIVLSLVVLEIGLQLASFTLITIKKYQNKVIKDPRVVTILCLGESTTDRQWPPILQKLLDEKSNNLRFNVVDEGHKGTNTLQILLNIQNYFLKYDPDIVIFMMGINDAGLFYIRHKLRLINLFNLLTKHIKQKFYEDCLDKITFSENMQEAQDLTTNGKYKKAEKIFDKLLKETSNSFCYSKYLEMLYISKQYKKLELLLDKKYYILHMGLNSILQYFFNVKEYTNSEVQKWIDDNIDRILIEDELKEYYHNKYNVTFNLTDKKERKYLIIESKEIKNTISTTLVRDINYNYCIEVAFNLNNKIMVIPMQYPNLPVSKLKEDLKDSRYYKKLIFISNEENFKQALQKYKKDEIFVDMFATSFGHCSDLGNTLIAENVANTILNLYADKNN